MKISKKNRFFAEKKWQCGIILFFQGKNGWGWEDVGEKHGRMWWAGACLCVNSAINKIYDGTIVLLLTFPQKKFRSRANYSKNFEEKG